MERSKIILKHEYPPIPQRTCDWRAYREGDEEIPARHGWGRTEAEALAELAVLEECGGRDIGARRWNPPRWPAHNTWLCAVSSESLIILA